MTTPYFQKIGFEFLTLLSWAFALTDAGMAVQAQTLQLNGEDIRQQAASPLYSAGLYLSEKFHHCRGHRQPGYQAIACCHVTRGQRCRDG